MLTTAANTPIQQGGVAGAGGSFFLLFFLIVDVIEVIYSAADLEIGQRGDRFSASSWPLPQTPPSPAAAQVSLSKAVSLDDEHHISGLLFKKTRHVFSEQMHYLSPT